MARIRSSEITPKELYLNRRTFMKASALGVVGASVAGVALTPADVAAQGLRNVRKSPLSTTEAPNSYDHITSFKRSDADAHTTASLGFSKGFKFTF